MKGIRIEQYFPVVLSIILLLRYVLTFSSVDEILNESFSSTFCIVLLFIVLCKVVLTVESVDETLKCDRSNKSY